MRDRDWRVIEATSAGECRGLIAAAKPDAALIDFMLPDGNGIELAVELLQRHPNTPVIIMTGTILPAEEEALCEEHNLPVLRKPFLASDLHQMLTARLTKAKRRPRTPTGQALKVFFCYSHRDQKMRDRLDAHLSLLKHMGIIHSWHDRRISAGSDWDATIDKYLSSADVILLLISPDFLNSDYCYRKEMKRALERHKAGAARVIPVILRPVDWDKAPFAPLQAVPTDGKPITRWANRDEGYLSAAKAIRKVAEELSATIRRK